MADEGTPVMRAHVDVEFAVPGDDHGDAADAILCAVVERVGDIALGPVVSDDPASGRVCLRFTVEAATMADAQKHVSRVLAEVHEAHAIATRTEADERQMAFA